MSKVFKKIARIQEVSKVIHGVWTKDNIFLYSTYNHFKYLLPNGDKGILRSINEIRCPVGLLNNTIYSYDIDYSLHKDEVSKEECMFKLALSQNDIAAVKAFAKTKKSQGSAMISYLHKKNYPAVALSLTNDLKSKFQLALKSGNLQTAYESAAALKSTECFEKLAEDALLQGCHSVGSPDRSWSRSGTKKARTSRS